MKKNAFAILALSLFAACHDARQDDITAPVGRFAVVERSSADLQRDEPLLADLAVAIPSFGGIYVEKDGTLAVWVRDPADDVTAKRQARLSVATGRIRGLNKQFNGIVEVRRAKYTIAELSRWRTSLRDAASEVGWQWLDLNEGENRIDIGVPTGDTVTAAATMRKAIQKLGVPTDAIAVRPAASFVQTTSSGLATGNTAATLQTQADTLIGGMRIGWGELPWYNGCSIGFVADLAGGGQGIVTASHCSPNLWGRDSSKFRQPAGASDSFVIGYEDVDPNPGTCPALWFCSYYRFSDAAIGRLTSRDRRKGYLARPAYRSYKESGTINLNSYGSYIRVDGTTGDIVQNSAIDGIGSTTGWLYGNVVATCVDFKPFDNKMRRCFYLAENKVDEGDSGGPVFYYDGQGIATAAGIIAARGGAPWITASDGMWFSKWSYVESELTGSAPKPAWISIVASDVSVTPTATIMGPSGIKPNASCYWYVSSNVAYSGAEWRVNGTLVGTGPDIYYSASSSFTLTVQLFAAVGFGASKSVTVGAEQNTCAVE